MPGLNQLKKFDADISPLGNEAALRQVQGTTIPAAPMPESLPPDDDSYDFEFGLPGLKYEGEEVSLDSEDDTKSTEQSDGALQDVFTSDEMEPEIADLLNNIGSAPSPASDLPDISDMMAAQDILEVSDIANIPGIPDISADILDIPEMSDIPDISDIPEISGIPEISDLGFTDTRDYADRAGLADSPDFLADKKTEDDDFDSGDLDELSLNADLSGDLNENLEVLAPQNIDKKIEEAADDFALDVELDDFNQLDEAEDSGADISSLEDVSSLEDGFSAATDLDDGGFEIPGFSDASAAEKASVPLGFGKKRQSHSDDDQDRTHLTDAEYKVFIKNLQSYPLNLRIALEQFIVKNEFTDAAVMEVLFKVVKKVPARQLAAHLEKMLDISITVPLNYERRTVEQYESYKTSLEYQLKNRIVPAAIAGLVLGGICYVLFYFGLTFIYKPIKAEILYKQGYSLIKEDLYSQSETKFNEALKYKEVKSWFFSYARLYREKHQYSRARNMYEQLIKRFKYDKKAGMEYALMELNDLANYEGAAKIVRRYILDYHINDQDAMLLLGDIYLDWADTLSLGSEKAAKFEEARLQYASLMALYKHKDLYLARMLRYFIRTDNLREVLPLKKYFTTKKQQKLGAQDLIDLGAYLFEKQYAYLPPADEYLRSYIDNVKKILESGLSADPSIPEGHYNLARYFIRTANSADAKIALQNAILNFEKAAKKTHRRSLKHIDSYRLLGEQYTAGEDYLSAEESYGLGIRLFEQEKDHRGLEPDENIGRLYSDMADLDYFISGDLQNALRNYQSAVANHYDKASIRYRIGFIQYDKGNYAEALGSFIKTASEDNTNRNLLLALGNVLSIRNDDFAARGYYERLIDILDADRARYGILLPQIREDQGELVDLYLRASNNFGVTLARLAEQTGNSAMQAEAMVQFSESVRAWDALTRNQITMTRLDGSNLAAQNIKYLTYPQTMYKPSIYAAIPRALFGDSILEQSALK